MNELIWKTEEEMQKELHIIEATRDYSNYGYDGHMLAATGEFEYKGMKYIINVMRYYVLAHPKTHRVSAFIPMDSQRKSEYFTNLEYPESMNEVREIVHLVRGDHTDFLYNDSLHPYSDNMDIEQQIAKMHEVAKEDIDSLQDLQKDIDEKINKMNEVKKRINEMIK